MLIKINCPSYTEFELFIFSHVTVTAQLWPDMALKKIMIYIQNHVIYV